MNQGNETTGYELHPYTTVCGFDDQAFEGVGAIEQELKKKIEGRESTVLCFDCYPGIDPSELRRLADRLHPSLFIQMEALSKSEEELQREFGDYLTDDRVFGVMCHKKLEDCFDQEKVERAREEIHGRTGLTVVAGVGTGLLCQGDITIYCSITRWEIQLRYREGMPNWCSTNYDAPQLEKYKRGFFVEWRLADCYKKDRYDRFDYVLETEKKDAPKMITGEAFRTGLDRLSRRPFRMEPYFDPGVWGGHWMQKKFGLDPEKENFAWSFDGVPEENSINMKFGNVTVKLPAIDLVFYRPKELLGGRVHARFGAEFPIRFDLLDTMGGGNLSLQVHPLTEYIQDNFGMHYTQDESYYILDADDKEETFVYLGVKDGVDRDAMAGDLREAEHGGIEFPVEAYINKVPVKKHDHILIPAGTIHCSGKNTMVLEISATPYIFTFKLWDWGRVGLDGIPRPIHVEHGLRNIQWDRDTDWIYDQAVHQERVLMEDESMKLERTGLHNFEFIDTFRYTIHSAQCVPGEVSPHSAWVPMDDSVHMMNLVDGSRARIISVNGEFEPFEIHYAETAIVPAGVGEYRVEAVDGECMLVVAAVRR